MRSMWLCGVLLASTVLAQMPDLPGSAKITEAPALAMVGDPKAIKPAMELLTAQSTVADPSAKDRQLKDAARIVGQFAYAPAVDVMKPLLANKNAGPSVRDEILIALSRMNDKSLMPLLKGELESNRSLLARSQAARALVEMGDPAGQSFLLTQYQAYLDSFSGKQQAGPQVREVLLRMTDEKLIEAIAATAEKQKEQTAKNNVTTLVQSMKTTARPVAEIVKIAEEPKWDAAYDRYDAVEALAERGTPAEIPVLLALKPWDGVPDDVKVLQRSLFRQKAGLAVNRIQQRCWPEIEKSGKPLVTDAQRQLEKLHGDPASPLPAPPKTPRPRPMVVD